MTEPAAIVGRILDRAERAGRWFPALAGLLLGAGIDSAFRGASYGWLLLAAGLLLGTVRPFGTGQRRRYRIRRARNDLRAVRERQT